MALPRGERPLASGDEVLVQFAGDLRLLREKAGTPTYRELSARAHYSVAALSEAASGRKLPSLSVTLAYVAACGGEVADWEDRWRMTAAELSAKKAATPCPGNGEPAPYVGLAAFQQEDAELFFGRDDLVTDLLSRVRQTRFLGVFGSSGCGKSSVLRAGLAARLAAGRAPNGLPVVVFMPGQHPFEECAIHLAQFLGESPGTLRDELAEDPRNLHRRIRQAATDRAGDADVVLVVDQFEELFTLCADEEERRRFVDALVIAATDPASRTRVVLGVRADFLGHCGRYPGLVTALQDAQVLIGAMSTDELRLAITGPAEQAGYRVETALVARLVADATRQPGMLPLVSHALLQTWLRRQGKVMTAAGYDAVGGIEHALARSAEATYQSMAADQQEIVQQIFLRLTAPGDGPEDTKRRIPRRELDHDDQNTVLVLDRLTRARLITVGHDSVEIAHEALIRHWPRLHDWLADDQDGHRLRRQLTEAAGEWERHERDDGLLYRGARLATWQDRPVDRLNDTERAFLTAGRRAVEREQRQRRRRVQLVIGALCAAMILLTVLAVLAVLMAVQADGERLSAAGRQLATDARTQMQFDPELGLLLARQAYAMAPSEDTEALLRQAAADSHIRATLYGPRDSRGQRDPMVGVAFSADGKQLATSGNSELRAWDWATGKVTRHASRKVKSYTGTPTFRATFSPDTRYVAETDAAGRVQLWDWADRTEPVMLLGPRDAVSSIAFSANGQHVAVGGQDGTIRIWNTAGDRDEPEVLEGHTGPVVGVAFGASGRGLASIGADGTLRVWDLLGFTDPVVLPTGDSKVKAVAFSTNGDQVATAHADGTIHVWDPVSGNGQIMPGSHAGAAESVTYGADGHWIASTGADGTVRIWNADRPAAPGVLRGHRGTVRAAAFSPDGKLVASVGADGTARVWDIDEVQDLTVRRGHEGPVSAVASSSDGRWVASGGEDGTILFWDVASNRAPAVVPGLGGPILQVTFAPKGGHFAAVDGQGILRIWDTDDLDKPKTQLSLPGGAMGRVAFSPDGTRLAVSVDGSVRIMTTTGAFVDELPYIPSAGPSVPALPVAWSPNGRHIAAVTMDGVVLSWDLYNHKEVSVLPGQPGQIGSLAFSPDSARLASAGDDGLIHLWYTASTTEPRVLSGHQGGAWSAAFSLDGRHLVTSGNDATVRVWTTNDTSEPLVLDGFRASVPAVVPLAGSRYVTVHDDGTVRIWRCHVCGPVSEVLDYASQHVTRELTAQERRTYLPTDP